jgi:hypothetical protein
MPKTTLPARLEPDLIARLQRVSQAKKASVNDTISCAMDALEREQKEGGSFAQRVAFLEKNLSALLDLVLTFSEKMDAKFSEASKDERDRMKSLYKLMEIKMDEHDEAEEVRFHTVLTSVRPGDQGVKRS